MRLKVQKLHASSFQVAKVLFSRVLNYLNDAVRSAACANHVLFPPFSNFKTLDFQIAKLRDSMGKGRAKSFKPHGKDKSRIARSAAKKKSAKKSRGNGIIRGRVETPKTE